jgi:tetratricopeptide (TPR) repeat protein
MKRFILLSLLLATPALAQESDPAKTEFKLGYDLRAQGRYAEAIAHLQESERLHPDTRVLLNLADCELKTRAWDDAEVHAVVGMERAREENRPELVKIAEDTLAELPVLPSTIASPPPIPLVERVPATTLHELSQNVREKPKSRAAVWALGGGAALGFGVGAFYGLAALAKNHDSNTSGQCNALGCNANGYALRNQARTDGVVSTAAFVAGLASLVGCGITLKMTW